MKQLKTYISPTVKILTIGRPHLMTPSKTVEEGETEDNNVFDDEEQLPEFAL